MTTPRTDTRTIFPHVRSLRLAAVAALAALLLAGCGQSDVGRKPQAARPAADTQQDFGDFEVHYNAIRTDQLSPDIARAYGIERSANRVLLNVAMLAKSADGTTRPLDGAVAASAHNLNGQLKSLAMRRVQEGQAVYFIGEVGISGEEILVFSIDLEPASGGGRRTVQFKREFFAD
jgi:hypothetical protein